ncbi:uncharacterized protein LOC122247057 [Penaeus japonicus]|uniref:uncharacterized protein LOC122247057 n=1 Tax=Penaeus japonicus TaxID=27405 RepID=UPI001C713B73|nr:uncharacterized protein LOC122247057 [Penaeus japonicus]
MVQRTYFIFVYNIVNLFINISRSDELYNFFQLWATDIYGELQEEEIFSKGFILVEEDTELWDEEEHEEGESSDSIGGELKDMTKESWEVVSMSEELRRALYSSGSLTSLDLEVFLPDVNGTTEIITDHVRKSPKSFGKRYSNHRSHLLPAHGVHGGRVCAGKHAATTFAHDLGDARPQGRLAEEDQRYGGLKITELKSVNDTGSRFIIHSKG